MTPDERTEAFVVACEWGNIQKAIRLWKEGIKYGVPVDLHKDDDRAFRHACYYGFLRLAKWLYKTSSETDHPIDIRYNDDYAFYYACENNQYHIAYWLSTLCPDYKLNVRWEIQ